MVKKRVKDVGYIHSLKGTENPVGDIIIIEEDGPNYVRAEYNGNICTGIFNVFVGMYYIDDVYGVIGPVVTDDDVLIV